MEKYIYDEKNGLHYELVGDYYLPCLTVEEPEQPSAFGDNTDTAFCENIRRFCTTVCFSPANYSLVKHSLD